MSEDIPEWAFDRVDSICGDNMGGIMNRSFSSVKAFARYIAEHEQPPVDPDLLLAREVASRQYESETVDQLIRDGLGDELIGVMAALAAIKVTRERMGNE